MNTFINKNHQLSLKQVQELNTLVADCKAADGHSIPVYSHLLCQFRPMAPNILYYHQSELIGFLAVFFFYEGACEVSLMVHPAWRKRGIAGQMLAEVLVDIHVDKLIFSAPDADDKDKFLTRGMSFYDSEYQMLRYSDKLLAYDESLCTIRLATEGDLDTLSYIHNQCFSDTSVIDASQRISALYRDTMYQLLIAEQAGYAVGKIHRCEEEDRLRIMDFAVLPAMQKKGVGGQLLIHCINYALLKNKPVVMLEVKYDNQSAIDLYKRFGFDMTNVVNYWVIELNGVKTQC